MKNISLFSLLICFIVQFYFGNVFYPNYNENYTNATIGWDVSGYYFYLPAVFIYNDIKKLEWKDQILDTYRPTPNLQQAYLHDSGNYIMKYSLGQSIAYLPWFSIAHVWSKFSKKYPADGFSWPYQFMISIGSLIFSFLGLLVLRKILLSFFSDGVTAISLISLVLGTNYLEFSTISGAMTHNSLFTIYTFLIYSTIQFYKKPQFSWAIIIGSLVGWAALIRPTEIISLIIPIAWGVNNLTYKDIQSQIERLINWNKFLFVSIVITILIGFTQLIYWKIAGGHWIIYSYQDQGFDWLHPHILDCLFSFKTGWMIYTPIMFFGILGFVWLIKSKKEGSISMTIFALVFTYLCFAWSEWWYGGSLSMRAMVQSYPIFIIAMAAFYEFVSKQRFLKFVIGLLIVLFCSYNLWLHRHAHKGGLLHAGNMTKAYFWKILGKNQVDETALKLLDTDEEYSGNPSNSTVIFTENFELSGDSTCQNISIIEGEKSLCLNKNNQYSEVLNIPIQTKRKWTRISANFRIDQKEWEWWRMTQMIVKAKDKEEKIIKTNLIRIQRFLNDGQSKNIYLDFSLPKGSTELSILFWNADGPKPIGIDNVIVEVFD